MTYRPKKRGRPKGARGQATIVREVANMTTTITHGESHGKVTVAEAMLLLLERRTMGGDVAADKALKRMRQRIAPEPTEKPGILLVPEPLDETEWIRRQEILNNLRPPPPDETPPGGAGGAPPDPKGGGSDPPAASSMRQSETSGQAKPANLRGRLIR